MAIIYVLPDEIGMAQALDLLKLPLEGIHYSGDDAWNIPRIRAELLVQTKLNK